MRTLTIFVSMFLIAAFAAPLAYAEGKDGKRGKKRKRLARHAFVRLDKNGDGKLTAAEVPARLWTRVSKCDGDGDGAVTREELKSCRKGKKDKDGGSSE